LNCRVKAVRQVHHGERGVLREEAGVLALLESVVKDLHSVVSGTTTGGSLSRDDTRITEGAEVNCVPPVVVLEGEEKVGMKFFKKKK